MPADYCLRRASLADLEAIVGLEKTCAEAPHWSPLVWTNALNDEQGSHPLRVTFVAEGDSGLLGFIVASCAFRRVELENLAVSAPARRRGLGYALCQQMMAWSRELGAETIELEVRASSEGAQTLYRSLGFVEQGRRQKYYSDPIEDSVLMAAPVRVQALD